MKEIILGIVLVASVLLCAAGTISTFCSAKDSLRDGWTTLAIPEFIMSGAFILLGVAIALLPFKEAL